MRSHISFLYCSILLLGAASLIKAEPASTEVSLSGTDITLEEAVAKSVLIFSGSITKLGHSDFRGKGSIVYDKVPTNVSKIYRGSAEPTIEINLGVRMYSGALLEGTPRPGVQYIFLIYHSKFRNNVIKVLPKTDDNIAKVKALIAAAPASK